MTLRAYRCAKGFLRGIEVQVPERWVCGAAAIVQQHVSTEEPAKPIWTRESLPVPCSPPYMSQRQCFQEAAHLKTHGYPHERAKSELFHKVYTTGSLHV